MTKHERLLAILLTLLFLASLARAQWVNLPDNTPYVFEWNTLPYSTTLHAYVVRGRINPCGDPFTNATFLVDANGNISQPIQWSGGGARVNGQCVAPVVNIVPTNGTPGDRHPFGGFTVANELNEARLFVGVEDAGKCDGTVPGVCAYQDNWHLDLTTMTWTQDAPFGRGNYNASLEYSVDAHKYYSVGGIIGGTDSNSIYSFDKTANVWTKIAYTGAVMAPRDYANVIGNIPGYGLLIFGGNGKSPTGKIPLTDMYVLNVQTNVLTKLNPAHTFTASFVCAAGRKAVYDSKRNRVVMYCGDTGMWVFDPVAIDWTNEGQFGGPGLPTGNYPGMQTMGYNPDDDSFMLEQGNAQQPFWKIPASQIPGGPSSLTLTIPNECLHTQVGALYVCQLEATGGQPPYIFSETGTLPGGLTFTPSTGVISGRPTQNGPFPIIATVKDSHL